MTIFARMIGLGLSLSLSLSLAFPAPAHAAAALEPERGALPPTRLVVDTTGLGDTADVARSLLVPWIETELRDRHAVPLTGGAGPASGATLTVTVSWARQMASDWKIELAVDDGSGPQKLDPFLCEGCGTEEEVADRIFEELPAAVALLRGEPASGDPSMQPPVPAAAEDAPTAAPSASEPPPRDRRARRPLGPLGKAGIPLMIVGAGAAIGGGVMIGLGERKDDSSTGVDRATTNLRPPGIALAAIGGAVLVGGTVMLVIDRVRAKRDRTAQTPAVVPVVSHREAGVALTFRF